METRSARYRHKRAKSWPYITVGIVLCAVTVLNIAVGNTSLGTYLPAVLGLPLLLYGLFRPSLDRFFSHGFGRVVWWIIIIAYIAVIVSVICASIAIGSVLMTPVQNGADAVVVLGAAVHGDEVTDTLEKRLNTAIEYYRSNPGTPIVVTGGRGSGENVSEAEAMREYLISHGITDTDIITEDQALNTRENFVFSRNLLEQQFGRPVSIVYVTSDFHVLRAGLEARKAGFDNAQALGAPTPILTVPGAWLRETAALGRSLVQGDFG